jgi:hypothetical protein
MRKNIYLAIVERLNAAGLGIKHISLWNNQIANVEKERGFALPAVLVEFDAIERRQLAGHTTSSRFRVRLHILTGTLATPESGGSYQTRALQFLDLIDGVSAAVTGLDGEGFNCLMCVESHTDHDHGEISDNIEVFVTQATDGSAVKPLTPAPSGLGIRISDVLQ